MTAITYFEKTAKDKDNNSGLKDAGVAAGQIGAGTYIGRSIGRSEDQLSRGVRQIEKVKGAGKKSRLIKTMNKLRKQRGIKGGLIGAGVGGALAATTYALKSEKRKNKAVKASKNVSEAARLASDTVGAGVNGLTTAL